MKRLILFFLLLPMLSFSQEEQSFAAAYSQNSFVPNGLLEAVSYTNTHIRNISTDENTSCSGMPLPYGVMGLFEDGANYFKENGVLVSSLSGISIANQKLAVSEQIMAYAKAFNYLMQQETSNVSEKNNPAIIYKVLIQLSEIPDSGIVNLFARDAQIYEVLNFMNSSHKANQFNFSVHHFNLKHVFGEANYQVLSAKRIELTTTGIRSENNVAYKLPTTKSLQYGPAIWNPAPACNISSRSGTAISAITIHTIQGTYAGAISWSQNCSSSVSYHYVVRSSDGQITQMVLEQDKAWHVGSENPYTIGYEHEGYITDASWYTDAMYTASADLSRDIVASGYGIPALRTYFGPATTGVNVLGACTKIKGHQHYPNQTHTDPGINWNWEKYYRLINNAPTITTVSATTGSFYDSGGAAASYQDDERSLWLFQPTNATSITLNFSAFNLESNYDYLFIYDGNSINAPLIGMYTGSNSPGSITATGNSLMVEFRSDCATVSSGWVANWTSIIPNTTPPTTSVENLNDWKTSDWTVNFTDNAVGTVSKSFYLAGAKPTGFAGWKANSSLGFLNEDFQDAATDWIPQTDVWSIANSQFTNTDLNLSNTNSYTQLQQDNQSSFMYHWKQTITSVGANQRAGLHFFCDDATLPNRGNSYFVYFRNSTNKAEIYSVVNDVFTMQTAVNCTVSANVQYDYKVYYEPQTGWIRVFVDGILVTEWQDPAPLQTGNFVSLRTGNCIVEYDNVRVYKSRNANATIGVGPTAAFFAQSDNASNAGLIRSFVLDDTDLWSVEAYELYKVDWTAPEISLLNDGLATDIDTNYTVTLDGNWVSIDPNSQIIDYQIAIGTSPLSTDILNWNTNGLVSSYSYLLSSPVYNLPYYISIRSTNGAGLLNELSSDGQRLLQPSSNSLFEGEMESIHVFPNPAADYLTFENIPQGTEIFLYTMEGKLVFKEKVNELKTVQLPEIANGIYTVLISNGNKVVLKKIEILK